MTKSQSARRVDSNLACFGRTWFAKGMAVAARRVATRSTAEVRRDQLLEIASRIVETEGVEALRPTRVAELAGCTRPLIYQYFPRREDIFIAITEELYKALDTTLSLELQTDVIPAASRGDYDVARRFMDRLWSYIDRHGPASLILRSTPEISIEFRIYLDRIRDAYEKRWLDAFMSLGLEATEAQLMLETFITITKVLALQHIEGEIDRETAIQRQLSVVGGFLQGLTPASLAC